MAAGLIADIAVVIFAAVMIILCTKRGFLRSLLRYTSLIVALVVALLGAGPLASYLNEQFGLGETIASWHIPFISAGTLLTLLTGVLLFLVVRLVLILLDKLLQAVKEHLRAVNAIDRILGTVFGALLALIELATLFMLIDALGWQEFLQLTPASGGYIAHHLFTFCKEYVFNIITSICAAAATSIPQI